MPRPSTPRLAAVAATAPRRILIVEDDAGIRILLGSTLRLAGYDVHGTGNGSEALAEIERFDPDLVVMDVMLPGVDGWEVTRAMRAAGATTPVLFLSARGEATDRVAGLSAGGDDYVTKPFNVGELLLRIRAILHRRHPADGEEDGVLHFADLLVDPSAHRVQRAGRTIDLTPTEFRLMTFLIRNPRQILSKKQIIRYVWSQDFAGDVRIVETYIRYLRRKIDNVGPPLIHTVRGIGYTLRLPREPGE